MKVKMLTMMAGPGGTFDVGTIREVDKKEGLELIAGRYAQAVDEVKRSEDPRKETAVDQKKKVNDGDQDSNAAG